MLDSMFFMSLNAVLLFSILILIPLNWSQPLLGIRLQLGSVTVKLATNFFFAEDHDFCVAHVQPHVV